MTAVPTALRVRRTGVRVRADPGRVITRPFLPGHELIADRKSRAGPVIQRILDLGEDQVEDTLAQTLARFSARHRRFSEVLDEHYALVAHRLGPTPELTQARRRLIGAYFTTEFAVEAAAVFNPSMVAHPDQGGLPAGRLRVVMSLRAVGEGHLSSIEFRTGTVDADGGLELDDPGDHLVSGRARPSLYDRDLFRRKLDEAGDETEAASFVLDALAPRFTHAELEQALVTLAERLPGDHQATVERFLWVAARIYVVEFPEETSLPERVLFPNGPAEQRGVEDARFVRLVDDDGTATYYATYTAFDGTDVAPHLLETADFRTFRTSLLSGSAARDKGMALFPRRVGGRYAALSRHDRESNSLTVSDCLTDWDEATRVQAPRQPWELVNVGNCGSPIETSHGWLVLTHGVGPVRTYSLGAVLLDLDRPERVLASLERPIMSTTEEEREGYVPNVLYSCGSLVVDGTLIIPYGIGDASVGVASVAVDELVAHMRPVA